MVSSSSNPRRARLFLPIRFPISCCHSCTRQETQIAFDKRQLDQPEVVESQLLIARRNCTTLFQPTDTLLDRTALAILDTVIGHRATAFPLPSASFGWDDRFDPTQPQPVANTLDIIGTVG